VGRGSAPPPPLQAVTPSHMLTIKHLQKFNPAHVPAQRVTKPSQTRICQVLMSINTMKPS